MSKLTDSQEPLILYGRNPVKEFLKTIKSGKLYMMNTIQKTQPALEILKKAEQKGLEIEITDKAVLSRIAGTSAHQGFVLSVKESYNENFTEDDFYQWLSSISDKKSTVLILDGIKDPGNLGSILRSALLFDVDAVILPKDNSSGINEVVIKRSAGAGLFVRTVYVTNLVRVIDRLKDSGFWIYGTDMGGIDFQKADYSSRAAVVVGDEGAGLRDLVKKNCDQIIGIPTNGKLDSLNVSVSCGIILSTLFNRPSV